MTDSPQLEMEAPLVLGPNFSRSSTSSSDCSLLPTPSVLAISAVFGTPSVLDFASVLGVGFRWSRTEPRVDANQHLPPSWPGARNVHDGQALGFSFRTASAEVRQLNACPRGIEVNIADAASRNCKQIEMDAGPLRHPKFLVSCDRPTASTRSGHAKHGEVDREHPNICVQRAMTQTCLGSRLHYRSGCSLRYWVALKRRSGLICFCASPFWFGRFSRKSWAALLWTALGFHFDRPLQVQALHRSAFGLLCRLERTTQVGVPTSTTVS